MTASVLGTISRWLTEAPNAPAIREGDRLLTYAEMWASAGTVAASLAERGVRPGDNVATKLRPSVEMVVTLLGIWRAGAAYVPADVASPVSRAQSMVSDASAAAIIIENDAPVEDWPALPLRLGDLATNAAPPKIRVSSGVDPLAYVIFTSGSTGRPKGVAVGHQALSNLLGGLERKLEIDQHDVMLCWTTPAFDVSGLEIWLPLVSGASMAIVPNEPVAEFEAFAAGIAAAKVTVIQGTPSAWRLMKEAGWRTSTVRWAICGGESLPDDLADWLAASLPRCLYAYGPTETTILSTAYLLDGSERVRPTPIGTPINCTEILLLDEERQPVAEGEIGQIHIGGRGLAKGYVADERLTAERFLAHPEKTGKRIYATGDLGVVRDGYLFYAGRKDNQVKIRGHRVEMEEIRSKLIRHEAVGDATVVASHSPDGSVELRAFVVPTRPLIESAVANETATMAEAWRETFEANFDDRHIAIEGDDTAGLMLNGWVSSVTGERLPKKEILCWGEATASAVAALHPRHVLEIGSGGGLIARSLAPQCETYLATDVSAAAVRRLGPSLAAEGLDVAVERMAAHELRRVKPRPTDAVILTSVIQYFPSEQYLRDVLEAAVELLPDGGVLFIGDVRHAGLLRPFHLWRERLRADGELDPDELLKRAAWRMAEEEELILDPAWFSQFAEEHPRIAAAHASPSLAAVCNELTMFRYQVTLFVGDAKLSEPAHQVVAWGSDVVDVSALEGALRDAPAGLVVRGVPDERISAPLRFSESLEVASKVESDVSEGVAPALLAAIGRRHDFDVAVELVADVPGTLDVHFTLTSQSRRTPVRTSLPAVRDTSSPRSLVRDPSVRAGLARLRREHAQDIRAHLGEALPQFMVPRRLVFVDALPLLPSGKIDQHLLTEMSVSLQGHRAYVGPKSETEKVVIGIWRSVLDVDADIGRDDSFVELGGHSLLAARVTVRLREHFKLELEMRLVFENPVVRDLAEAIDCALRGRNGEAMPIRRVERPTLSEWQRLNSGRSKAPPSSAY